MAGVLTGDSTGGVQPRGAECETLEMRDKTDSGERLPCSVLSSSIGVCRGDAGVRTRSHEQRSIGGDDTVRVKAGQSGTGGMNRMTCEQKRLVDTGDSVKRSFGLRKDGYCGGCGTRDSGQRGTKGSGAHWPRICAQSRGVVLVLVLLVFTRLCDGASSYVWSPTKAPSSDITCWTCHDKANNEECNDWAPDIRCPTNQTVCQTVHRFSKAGMASVYVTKRCVHTTECTLRHVGCTQNELTGQQECVSCCDYSYCNQEVPVNSSTALELSSFATTSPSSTAATARPHSLPLVLGLVAWLLCVSHTLRSRSPSGES